MTEFSFILKCSKHGIGVFATHLIKKGAYLRLFGDIDKTVVRKKKDIPEIFRKYCLDRGKVLLCPNDFGCMEVGWYLNHSKKPNACFKVNDEDCNYEYYAIRDIKKGEEILIDYNTLEDKT
jgi:SET domain-containing protein